MNQFSFKDNSAYKYFSMIPHLITEIGLKGNEIAVYVAIKRSAGETSVCTKSKAKLAKQAGVCPKTIFTIIQKLSKVNKILKKPLIVCHSRVTQDGDQDTNLIEITDIWPESTSLFNEIISGKVNFTSPQVNNTQPKVTVTQGGVRYPLPDGQVNFTYKEEPLNKNPSSSSSEKKTEEAVELDKKIFLLIEECQKKELPFSRGTLLSIFKETSGAALELALRKFQKRSKNLKPLDLPDAWLRKNAVNEFEFELQKQEAEGKI